MNEREQAKKLFDDGLSPAEISEKLGIPANKIRAWKSRYRWGGQNVAQQKTQRKAQQENPQTRREISASALLMNTW